MRLIHHIVKPAMPPMPKAAPWWILLQPAHMATMPHKPPLMHVNRDQYLASPCFIARAYFAAIAVTDPAAPPIMVFINDTETAKPCWPPSPTIFNSDPPLKARKPKNKIKAPNAAIGTECPGIVNCFISPSAENLPILGPMTMAPISAQIPPVQWTIPDPAKSTY